MTTINEAYLVVGAETGKIYQIETEPEDALSIAIDYLDRGVRVLFLPMDGTQVVVEDRFQALVTTPIEAEFQRLVLSPSNVNLVGLLLDIEAAIGAPIDVKTIQAIKEFRSSFIPHLGLGQAKYMIDWAKANPTLWRP